TAVLVPAHLAHNFRQDNPSGATFKRRFSRDRLRDAKKNRRRCWFAPRGGSFSLPQSGATSTACSGSGEVEMQSRECEGLTPSATQRGSWCRRCGRSDVGCAAPTLVD